MSNLDKRLQGKRVGRQSMLEKRDLKNQQQKRFAYKVIKIIMIINIKYKI